MKKVLLGIALASLVVLVLRGSIGRINPAPDAAPPMCAACHAIPDPGELPRAAWDPVLEYMGQHMTELGFAFSPEDFQAARFYYRLNSPEALADLPPIGPDTILGFAMTVVAGEEDVALPMDRINSFRDVTNVNVVDLDEDGRMDLLVTRRDAVQLHQLRGDAWQHRTLATFGRPVHTELVDHNQDGLMDIVVADLGSVEPSGDLVGRVVVLLNRGGLDFEPVVLLEQIGRLADVRPGDFDGDGDVDYAVAVFGFPADGMVGVLEQGASGQFEFRSIIPLIGAVNVPVTDLDGDGDLDIVALMSQDHEEIIGLMNDGSGGFEARVMFRASSPLFGSSGIDIVDLDQDGDPDVLFTNGDAVDGTDAIKRPYHGVQWLENRGDGSFDYRPIAQFYGAYRAVADDLDGDGDLDVAVVSALFTGNENADIIWLQNDGSESFAPHGVTRGEHHMMITADTGDLDGDGTTDLVTGGLMGLRVWSNR